MALQVMVTEMHQQAAISNSNTSCTCYIAEIGVAKK